LNGFKEHKRYIALGLVGVLVVAGGAFAFWTGGGSGSGDAGVGTSGSLVLSATVAPGVAPGESEPVTFTAANPSNSPIQLTSLSLDSVAADGGHPSCETGDFSMEDVTQDHQVPANATAEALPNDGVLAYANTAVNQDGCKDATLTLTLSSD